jgi:hypothetical protein
MNFKTLAVVGALLSTTSFAYAENFDNTGVSVTAETGRISFTVEASENTEYDRATVTWGAFDFNKNGTYGGLDFYLSHYDGSVDQVGVGVDYKIGREVTSDLNVYGILNAEYVTDSNDLDSGDVVTNPSVGVSYNFNDRLYGFTEVSYAWNASDSFARQGGEIEVGVDYVINDKLYITPSLVRKFDQQVNDTQLNIGLNVRF